MSNEIETVIKTKKPPDKEKSRTRWIPTRPLKNLHQFFSNYSINHKGK
jgi:hypothetical protein